MKYLKHRFSYDKMESNEFQNRVDELKKSPIPIQNELIHTIYDNIIKQLCRPTGKEILLTKYGVMIQPLGVLVSVYIYVEGENYLVKILTNHPTWDHGQGSESRFYQCRGVEGLLNCLRFNYKLVNYHR